MRPKKKKRRADSRAAKHVARGWEAVEAGNLDLACREIRRARNEREGNPVVLNDCGLIFSMAGRERDAELSFREAILVAPTYAEAYVNLAALLAKRGRTIQASRYQRRAVELKPAIPYYRELLARYEAQAAEDTARE